MTLSFEAKLRQLQEEAAEVLPKLCIADLLLAAEHHTFLAQATRDELARRRREQ